MTTLWKNWSSIWIGQRSRNSMKYLTIWYATTTHATSSHGGRHIEWDEKITRTVAFHANERLFSASFAFSLLSDPCTFVSRSSFLFRGLFRAKQDSVSCFASSHSPIETETRKWRWTRNETRNRRWTHHDCPALKVQTHGVSIVEFPPLLSVHRRFTLFISHTLSSKFERSFVLWVPLFDKGELEKCI